MTTHRYSIDLPSVSENYFLNHATQSKNAGFFTPLPNEIILAALRNVNWKDLVSLKRTCVDMYRFVNLDRELSQNICKGKLFHVSKRLINKAEKICLSLEYSYRNKILKKILDCCDGHLGTEIISPEKAVDLVNIISKKGRDRNYDREYERDYLLSRIAKSHNIPFDQAWLIATSIESESKKDEALQEVIINLAKKEPNKAALLAIKKEKNRTTMDTRKKGYFYAEIAGFLALENLLKAVQFIDEISDEGSKQQAFESLGLQISRDDYKPNANPQQLKEFFIQALDVVFPKIKDKARQIEFLCGVAKKFSKIETQQAKLIQQAIVITNEMPDNFHKIDSICDIAKRLLEINPAETKSVLQKAENAVSTIRDSSTKIMSLQLIAHLYSKVDSEKAKTILQKVIIINDKIVDNYRKTKTYFDTAQSLLEIDPELAKFSLKMAWQTVDKDPNEYVDSFHYKIDLLNKVANAFLKADLKHAETILSKISNSDNGRSLKVKILCKLADSMAISNPNQARFHLQEAEHIAKQIFHIDPWTKSCFEVVIHICKLNFDEAKRIIKEIMTKNAEAPEFFIYSNPPAILPDDLGWAAKSLSKENPEHAKWLLREVYKIINEREEVNNEEKFDNTTKIRAFIELARILFKFDTLEAERILQQAELIADKLLDKFSKCEMLCDIASANLNRGSEETKVTVHFF